MIFFFLNLNHHNIKYLFLYQNKMMIDPRHKSLKDLFEVYENYILLNFYLFLHSKKKFYVKLIAQVQEFIDFNFFKIFRIIIIS